jgi:hypothetical protein
MGPSGGGGCSWSVVRCPLFHGHHGVQGVRRIEDACKSVSYPSAAICVNLRPADLRRENLQAMCFPASAHTRKAALGLTAE